MTSPAPAISVIVPVYNVKNYLCRCIDSILSQTFPNFELVLVNDGSTDGSGELCDRYKALDSRISVIHKINEGASSARNAGLDAAKGEFILFVDSDDMVYPEYLEHMYSPKFDLSICSMDIYRHDGQYIRTIAQKDAEYCSKMDMDFPLLYSNLTLYSPCYKLFRQSIIHSHHIRFPADVSWGEDGMFVAKYLIYVENTRLISYAGYRYIKYDGENNLSTRVRPDVIDMVCLSREFCISAIQEHAPWAYEDVRRICTKDILGNCATFVRMLLCSKKMSHREKVAALAQFSANSYVRTTFEQAEIYYPASWQRIFTLDAPEKMLAVFRRIQFLSCIKNLPFTFYNALPIQLKQQYRKLKRLFYDS